MQPCSVELACHPVLPCTAVRSISVRLQGMQNGGLALAFQLTGDISQLRVPASALPRRTDRLWTHTCFEAFIGLQDQSAYYEFNLSPSSEWAAYAFHGYRAAAPFEPARSEPRIRAEQTEDTLALDSMLRLRELPLIASHTPLMLGLAAVIEDTTGALSYWALKHRPGRPDFHHADAFALALPAIETWRP